MTSIDHFTDQALRMLSLLEANAERRYLGGVLPALAEHPGSDRGVAIDLRSNDYLGLAQNPAYNHDARAAMTDWPVGASASRLLAGESPIFATVEQQFAEFKQAPSALLMSSGFAANEAVICALARAFPQAIFYSDQYNHASTIDGLRAAGITGSRKLIYRHNDMQDLRNKLQTTHAPFKIILSESTFSMHGDCTPLTQLEQLAKTHHALLVIDEAHSLGVQGTRGQGQVLNPQIVTINPCGKAFAAQGAFICGPTWLRDLTINMGRPFIYSTALSPCIAAALSVSIKWVTNARDARTALQSLSRQFRQVLSANIASDSQSPIVFLPSSSSAHAIKVGKQLSDRGIAVSIIRPPTTPVPGIRISLHAGLSSAEVDYAATAISEVVNGAHGSAH